MHHNIFSFRPSPDPIRFLAQYDTEGTVVILTDTVNVNKYQNLVQGQQAIESCLQENLIEHINAGKHLATPILARYAWHAPLDASARSLEIVLGSITHLGSAMLWLKSTFFHIRVLHHPTAYGLERLSSSEIEQCLEGSMGYSCSTPVHHPSASCR